MPTYIYQTIGTGPGEESRRFEQFQKMNDQALTHDLIRVYRYNESLLVVLA